MTNSLDILDSNDDEENAPLVQTKQDAPISPSIFKNDYRSLELPINVEKEVKGEINRTMFEQEMEVYDVMLYNQIKGYVCATSVAAINALTRNALEILRQRRAALEHAMNLKPDKGNDDIEFDEMGNLIRS